MPMLVCRKDEPRENTEVKDKKLVYTVSGHVFASCCPSWAFDLNYSLPPSWQSLSVPLCQHHPLPG